MWLCPFITGPTLPFPFSLCSGGLLIFIATMQSEKTPQERPDPPGKSSEDHPKGHLPLDALVTLSGSVSCPGALCPCCSGGAGEGRKRRDQGAVAARLQTKAQTQPVRRCRGEEGSRAKARRLMKQGRGRQPPTWPFQGEPPDGCFCSL